MGLEPTVREAAVLEAAVYANSTTPAYKAGNSRPLIVIVL